MSSLAFTVVASLPAGGRCYAAQFFCMERHHDCGGHSEHHDELLPGSASVRTRCQGFQHNCTAATSQRVWLAVHAADPALWIAALQWGRNLQTQTLLTKHRALLAGRPGEVHVLSGAVPWRLRGRERAPSRALAVSSLQLLAVLSSPAAWRAVRKLW